MRDQPRVSRIASIDLRVGSRRWAFAGDHGEAIARHWQRRRGENPALFNGRVHVLVDWELAGSPPDAAARDSVKAGTSLRGTFAATDFASFLFWRETGYPEAGARDCFGSALIRSAEGHLLLGKAARHTINPGLAYPPGGFIDAKDVEADRHINLQACITREILEEVGLDDGDLSLQPGYWLTEIGPFLSIAAEYHSPLGSAKLREKMMQHLRRSVRPELDGVVIVRARGDLADMPAPAFVQPLLEAVLAG